MSTNLICPICKELIKDPLKAKAVYINCQELRCHVDCIRTNINDLDRFKYSRKSVIKIRKDTEL